MTDDELIKRLRSCSSDEAMWSIEAANRIEQLVRDRRLIIDERDRTFALMLTRAETAEAKLALAIEALRKVVPYWDKINPLRSADMHRSDCDCYRCAFDYARAVLAELEKTE